MEMFAFPEHGPHATAAPSLLDTCDPVRALGRRGDKNVRCEARFRLTCWSS